MQQKSNGVHQACAACKHQRKKCSENCVLAPFFPSEKAQQFQAVHKLFGVSNVSKILRNLKTHEEREKAIHTLVWEAQWRMIDPIFGCYGHYKKICEELKMLKSQQQVGVTSYSDAMLYKSGLIGWNNSINGAGVEISFSNGNYVDNNGSFAIEATPFDYIQVQDNNNGTQGRDTVPVSGNSISCIGQQYFLPDQYTRMNGKVDKTMRD